MYNRLQALYELQQIDTQLDELNETHGDLPKEAEELRARFSELNGKVTNFKKSEEDAISKRSIFTAEIADLTDKEKKYRDQQYNVKTNRQYDALVKEIEIAEKRIVELRAAYKPLDEQEAKAKEGAVSLQEELGKLEEELKLKELELEESKLTTNKEESNLQAERAKAVAIVTEADLEMYDRIRKARGGNAIALVRRNSCSGCFNMVTPQKQVELRRFTAIHTCENCGRILVPEEIMQKSSV
ncbi:MAG TPA: C4-type zinc ribbon domain-containing protein [Candidatus Kapabacteria bacterium]|nr:C4-type zinc ribbon domain-containing protein [Candidatus Kapabacteria bacterium]